MKWQYIVIFMTILVFTALFKSNVIHRTRSLLVSNKKQNQILAQLYFEPQNAPCSFGPYNYVITDDKRAKVQLVRFQISEVQPIDSFSTKELPEFLNIAGTAQEMLKDANTRLARKQDTIIACNTSPQGNKTKELFKFKYSWDNWEMVYITDLKSCPRDEIKLCFSRMPLYSKSA